MAEYIEANTRRLLACWVDTTQHKALGHMVTTISQPASQSGDMALVARAPHTTPLLLNECVWLGEGSEAEASTIDGRVCGMRMAQQPNTKHTSKTIISTTLFLFHFASANSKPCGSAKRARFSVLRMKKRLLGRRSTIYVRCGACVQGHLP